MKQPYSIFALFLISLTAKGQSRPDWTDFDTLKVYPDKIFVAYRTYSDSSLIEEGQAFLYPDTLEIRESRWLPKFISEHVAADSAVLHGTVTSKWKEGNYRIGEYNNGQIMRMNYYDSSGNKITRLEFYGALRSQRDPEQGTNIYFVHGTRKDN